MQVRRRPAVDFGGNEFGNFGNSVVVDDDFVVGVFLIFHQALGYRVGNAFAVDYGR